MSSQHECLYGAASEEQLIEYTNALNRVLGMPHFEEEAEDVVVTLRKSAEYEQLNDVAVEIAVRRNVLFGENGAAENYIYRQSVKVDAPIGAFDDWPLQAICNISGLELDTGGEELPADAGISDLREYEDAKIFTRAGVSIDPESIGEGTFQYQDILIIDKDLVEVSTTARRISDYELIDVDGQHISSQFSSVSESGPIVESLEPVATGDIDVLDVVAVDIAIDAELEFSAVSMADLVIGMQQLRRARLAPKNMRAYKNAPKSAGKTSRLTIFM